jgi:ketosteroid isomerase-like protein
VWPRIEDFQFLVGLMKVVLSPDRLVATAAVPWDSTGFDEDGRTFPRPGRATIVLCRTDVAAPWRCIHTHFSLARGVPPHTFGRRPTAR